MQVQSHNYGSAGVHNRSAGMFGISRKQPVDAVGLGPTEDEIDCDIEAVKRAGKTLLAMGTGTGLGLYAGSARGWYAGAAGALAMAGGASAFGAMMGRLVDYGTCIAGKETNYSKVGAITGGLIGASVGGVLGAAPLDANLAMILVGAGALGGAMWVALSK